MVLASLVVAGLAAGFFGQRAGTHPLVLNPEAPKPRPQTARERIWRAARFEPLQSYAAWQGGFLEMPTLLRVDRRDNLYILDSARSVVIQLSPEGRMLARYEDSSVVNPTDVAVGEGGEVWMCDTESGGVAVFSANGQIERRIRLAPAAGRLIPDPAGGFVATSITGGEGLFRRYSDKGDPKRSFGALFQKDFQTWAAADGWFVPAGPGLLIYPFRNAGLLISYAMDGRLRFFRQTIHPVPLPRIKVDAAGRPSVPAETPVSTVSGSVVGDSLYLLTPAGDGKVLDVYGTVDGGYRYSMKPPEPDARYVVLTEDRLYSASRRGVTIWKR
jgi:DNA-binding beta-propeller fold protein YncE